MTLTLSQTTNFRLFQAERVCDNFKLDENVREFSKRVENTVEKGEIACYEPFLLFPQCFQKTFTADTYKPGLVWERVLNLSEFFSLVKSSNTIRSLIIAKAAFSDCKSLLQQCFESLLEDKIVFVKLSYFVLHSQWQ